MNDKSPPLSHTDRRRPRAGRLLREASAAPKNANPVNDGTHDVLALIPGRAPTGLQAIG